MFTTRAWRTAAIVRANERPLVGVEVQVLPCPRSAPAGDSLALISSRATEYTAERSGSSVRVPPSSRSGVS